MENTEYTLNGQPLYDGYFYKHVKNYVDPLVQMIKDGNDDDVAYATDQLCSMLEFSVKEIADLNTQVESLADINNVFVGMVVIFGFCDLTNEEQCKLIDKAAKIYGHEDGIDWLNDRLLDYLQANQDMKDEQDDC